jgi:hypothetical protein
VVCLGAILQILVVSEIVAIGETAAPPVFARLISHQSAVLFSQNKPATSQQYSSLRTNQPPANRTSWSVQ